MNEQTRLVLSAVLPVFGIIGVGLVLRRLNWLTEEADQSLLRVSVNLLFPCLILDKSLGNEALSGWSNLGLAPALGCVTVAAGMGVAIVASRLGGLAQARGRRTFAVTVGIYNYAYLPLPLSLHLFGNATTGVLFVYGVGAELTMWTLGIMLLSGTGVGGGWRKIINAPVAAILLALVLNAVGLNEHIPSAVRNGVGWLGGCAVPMALILIGAIVADHIFPTGRESRSVADGESSENAPGWRVIGAAVLLRILLLPILFLILAKYLPASRELRQVLVLQAAMPSAVFPIVLCRHYGGDTRTALRVVLGTCAVALVTIPIWLRIGLKFVGL